MGSSSLEEQLDACRVALEVFRDAKANQDWLGYVELLLEMADLLVELERLEESLPIFLEAKEIAAKSEEPYLMATVAREHGWTLSELEQPEAALPILQAGLQTLEGQEQPALLGSMWHELAFALHLLGDDEGAAAGYRAAIDAWMAVDERERDWQELVLEHRCLADKLGELGQFQQALATLQTAQALWEDSPKSQRQIPDRVEVQLLRATMLDRLQRFDEALSVCRDVEQLLLEQPTHDGLALAEVKLQTGLLLRETGDVEAALEACQSALQQCADDDRHQSQCHWWIGHILEELERFEEALDSYRRAVELERRLGAERVGTMSRVGGVLERLGRVEEALKVYEEDLEEAEELPSPIERCTEASGILHRLGDLHKRAGRLQKALDCYRDALDRYRALPIEEQDLKLTGWSLMQVGFTYAEMGSRARALEIFREARSTAELTTPEHRAELLSMIGQELWSLGRLQEALSVHQEARAVMEQVPEEERDWHEYGKVLRQLGGALFEMGLIERALEVYRRSLLAHAKGPEDAESWKLRAVVHHNMGVASLYLERYEDALGELQLARSAHGCVPEAERDWEEYANTVAHIASCLRTLGRDSEAEEALDEAQIAELRARPELFVN